MNRLLAFHYHGSTGGVVRMAPSAIYLEGEYEKVRVRVYAEEAPKRDATFELLADGVSLLRTLTSYDSNNVPNGTSDSVVTLTANTNSEEIADDFNKDEIADGKWVYCNILDAGGGSNFTVQVELAQLSEDEEPD